MSELETLREIMLNLDRSWKDPAADLAKKAMNNRIQLLEEHFAEVRKRLSDPEYGTQEEM